MYTLHLNYTSLSPVYNETELLINTADYADYRTMNTEYTYTVHTQHWCNTCRVQSFGGSALKHLLHHCRSPAYQDRLAETRRVSSRAPVWCS